MAQYDDYDEYEDDQEVNGGNDLLSQLRKANKAQAKELKELKDAREASEKAIADLTKEVNGTKLAKLLETKGVNPKVSKFLKDVEPTEESLDAWLADNGELIGWQPKGSEGEEGGEAVSEEGEELTPEMAALMKAMGGVQKQEANAAPGHVAGPEDVVARIGANAKSFEDAVKGLTDAGIIKF